MIRALSWFEPMPRIVLTSTYRVRGSVGKGTATNEVSACVASWRSASGLRTKLENFTAGVEWHLEPLCHANSHLIPGTSDSKIAPAPREPHVSEPQITPTQNPCPSRNLRFSPMETTGTRHWAGERVPRAVGRHEQFPTPKHVREPILVTFLRGVPCRTTCWICSRSSNKRSAFVP